MDTNTALNTIFNHVRKNGQLVDTGHRKFGGVWSQDQWVLGNLVAKLQDDGYTMVVTDSDHMWCVRQTADFPVVIDGISPEDFMALATL